MRVLALAFFAAWIGGCVVSPLAIDGLRCPCGPGYTCDTPRDVCVRALGDAGLDAIVPVDTGLDGGPIDANVIDTGAIDAAGPDTGPLDSTACDDAFAGALFCSGFERMDLLDWAGVTMEGGGIGAWSGSAPYRGTGAFHSRVEAAGARGEIAGDLSSPISSGSLYLRFYAQLGPSPVSFRIAAMALGPTAAASQGITLQIRASETVLTMTTTTTAEYPASTDIPRGRWVCVQIGMSIGASGSLTMAFDGTTVVSQSAINTVVTGGYDRIRAGISWSSTSNTTGELFLDEVVLDDAPVPCD